MFISQCRNSESVQTSGNKAYKIVKLIQCTEGEGEGACNQILQLMELPEEK